MRVALAGDGGSGKSTLFDAITAGAGAQTAHAGGIEVRLGHLEIPDERVEKIAQALETRKTTRAGFDLMDLPGLTHGGKRNAQIISQLRQSDAMILVLEAFGDAGANHATLSENLRDTLAEFVLADLEVVEKRISKLKVQVTKPTPTQKHDKAELALMERIAAAISDGRSASSVEMDHNERRMLSSFQLLSGKAFLAVVNVDEECVGADIALDTEASCLVLSAGIEKDLAELPDGERRPFMEDLGIRELVRESLARACVHAFDLVIFITGNRNEVRSWIAPRGTKAVEAAGMIHTDMEKGFIRAQVASAQDFAEAGSMKAALSRGKARLEDRDYVVQDGDVIELRFSR